ncbi:UNVERIFIED_CONTAM: endonuclease/exonuclease/phosphatase family protein [Kocuria sp. CPCC 205316]|uniref:endonuclease/exonuclease/phosphatase family protein n=1 Tax=Kocuria TaxID=57493 RepID=UPI0036DBA56A
MGHDRKHSLREAGSPACCSDGTLNRFLSPLCLIAALGWPVMLLPSHAFGLWNAYPIVQVHALPMVGIFIMVLCIVCAGVVLHRASATCALRRTALTVMIIVLSTAVLVEGAVFYRAGGFLSAGSAAVAIGKGDLTVLSFNARDTSASDLAQVTVETTADAVLLVETSRDVAVELVQRLHWRGIQSQLFMGSGSSLAGEEEVAIIVTEQLGIYHESPGPSLAFGAVTVQPVSNTRADTEPLWSERPVLSAVHPPAPLPGKVPASVWTQQLQAAVAPCRQQAAIVGGDFNASSTQIAQVMGRDCIHAGTHLGRGSVGTWPTVVPSPLGASIDHQLADGNLWEPVRISFMDVGRSDHRAVTVSYRAINS